MNLSKEALVEEAGSVSFKPDVFEKAVRLIDLLNAISSHEFLSDKLALKGGTALNLFVFDLPRLSIDIDLNYIGSTKLTDLKEARPLIEQALSNLCLQMGYNIKRVPSDHAGGKWLLGYNSPLGATANLQFDINYLLRVPLWSANHLNSHKIGSHQANNILVLDKHELAAGKLSALLSRAASRDLFDTSCLAQLHDLNKDRLRLASVIYGAMNPKDWSTVSPETIDFDLREIRERLLPVLRTSQIATGDDLSAWAARLVAHAKTFLSSFFPLHKHEVEFISKVLTSGMIEPQLITADPQLAANIQNHPGLLWRALQAKR